jgi:8-hydroxy-5-deazaflavin:NADPH oxidoreductase
MKIGILGSGSVGKTLALGFIGHGHDVTIGARTAATLAQWGKANSKARTGTFADAAKFGDVLVLAVKGTAAADALRAAGSANLAGKVVLDATNPIADAPPENGVLSFFTTLEESLMERLQRQFPDTRFVKAFNSVGSALMVNPKLRGGPPSMFICGNDDGAKKIAGEILTQFGWETEDLGKANAARAIEPLCMLWCISGFLGNDWAHAYKVLR